MHERVNNNVQKYKTWNGNLNKLHNAMDFKEIWQEKSAEILLGIEGEYNGEDSR